MPVAEEGARCRRRQRHALPCPRFHTGSSCMRAPRHRHTHLVLLLLLFPLLQRSLPLPPQQRSPPASRSLLRLLLLLLAGVPSSAPALNPFGNHSQILVGVRLKMVLIEFGNPAANLFWATHEGGQQTARDGQRLERSQRQQPTTRRAHASATVFCGGESQDNRERSSSTLKFAAAGACGAETAAAATHGSKRVTYAARFFCKSVNNFRFIAGIAARVFASLLGAFHLRCFDGE